MPTTNDPALRVRARRLDVPMMLSVPKMLLAHAPKSAPAPVNESASSLHASVTPLHDEDDTGGDSWD